MSAGLLTVEQLQDRVDQAEGQIALQRFRILSIDVDTQELRVLAPVRPEFHRGVETGRWHGGALASVIDSIAVFALVALTGRGAPTVNLRVDYLKPATGDLTIVGRLRRLGRTVAVSDVEAFDAQGALVALGRATLSTTPA